MVAVAMMMAALGLVVVLEFVVIGLLIRVQALIPLVPCIPPMMMAMFVAMMMVPMAMMRMMVLGRAPPAAILATNVTFASFPRRMRMSMMAVM